MRDLRYNGPGMQGWLDNERVRTRTPSDGALKGGGGLRAPLVRSMDEVLDTACLRDDLEMVRYYSI